MFQQPLRFMSLGLISAIGVSGTLLINPLPAFSQIQPDRSLGAENSVITPNVQTVNGIIDRIDGGAIRGDALFHSFSVFNVNENQRVYFANPAAIATIFSRVTGTNTSEILGTLGVLGDADLYLINPNGVFFGTNAQLDIRGSFVTTTANELVFENGYQFSAASPNAPPILTVNSPMGLASWLSPTAGTITNRGSLSVGQSMALAGHNLDLQGELWAGGDLTLQAADTLTVRDTPSTPFIASAGDLLLLQGNRYLDIFALNHSDSGLFSAGSMVLRSDSPIIGDAHYVSGGNFQVEQVDGSPGILTSPHDPVVRVSGNVSLDRYEGASLHILAGGSITANSITITGPDTLANSLREQVTLSDGETVVSINGNAQPTLDLRAGTLAHGSSATGGVGTSAAINIGNISNVGGLVFLTNQYQPNPNLSGGISVGDITTATNPNSGLDGGQVVMDARGRLTFNNIDTSGGDYANFNVGGNGGDVTLLAQSDIFMPFRSSIYSYGLWGGAITLTSGTAIIQENGPLGFNPFDLSWIETDTFAPVRGNDIRFTAPTISIGGNIYASNEGEGRGGDIIFSTDTLTTNQATIATVQWDFGGGTAGDVIVSTQSLNQGIFSFMGSANHSASGGQGGDVHLRADSIVAQDGGQIGALTFATGDAGNVFVTARDISLSGFLPEDLAVAFADGQFTPSGLFSSAQGDGFEGNSGNVRITTDTLTLTDGAQIFTAVLSETSGQGNSGNIIIDASESVWVDGAVFPAFANDNSQPTAIYSEVGEGVVGQGGNIQIVSPVINVTGGGTISAVSDGNGNAGSIRINASESVFVDGIEPFAQVGQRDRISQIAVFAAENSTGDGGNLTITTPFLSLTNNGQLTAETLSGGDAGDIKLNVRDTVLIDGEGSGILSNTSAGSTGDGGNITIDPRLVLIQNGGRIAVDSQGSGSGGNIWITSDQLQLINQGLITAETVSADGGNITLNIGDVLLMLDNSRISATAGTALAGGDGGNVNITTTYLIGSPNDGNNDITANAFSGAGGNVIITADGIFGIAPLSRAELETLLGTSDPALLDPANLSSNDITAISQENPNLQGQVDIRSPDVDPSQGIVALPEDIVDASRLIAQGCASGGSLAQDIGSLVVIGRGGLPASPSANQNSRQLLLDWATIETGAGSSAASTIPDPPESTGTTIGAAGATIPHQLQEVQSLAVGADGQVVLLAQDTGGAGSSAWLPTMTCAGTVEEN